MFRAVKSPYEFEVTLKGNTVRVKPLGSQPSKGLIDRTLARCEEFLAQVFLQEQAPKVSIHNLAGYFRNRCSSKDEHSH